MSYYLEQLVPPKARAEACEADRAMRGVPARPVSALTRFSVAVRRGGKTAKHEVLAGDWFEAWSGAVSAEGLECRIEVRAAP